MLKKEWLISRDCKMILKVIVIIYLFRNQNPLTIFTFTSQVTKIFFPISFSIFINKIMGKALLHLLSNCSTSLNDITRCMVSQVHDITQVVLVNNYSMWSNTLLSLLFRFLCSSCNIRNFIVSLFIKKNNIVMSIMFWVSVAKYFCTTFRNILLTIRSLISLYL